MNKENLFRGSLLTGGFLSMIGLGSGAHELILVGCVVIIASLLAEYTLEIAE